MYEVTRQDKRALSSADSVTFHLIDGRHVIRAHRRGEHTSSGFDEYHEIPCEGSVEDYSKGRDPGTTYAAFHAVMYSKHDLVWQTILRRIPVGGAIRLIWVRSNDNENMRKVGFHRDELRLRTGKADGKPADEFHVAVSVGPDNTARMIRRV